LAEPLITGDAYGNGPVSRYVTNIRGEAYPGNSGGPAVNREGEVVGTVFASAQYGDVAYAMPPSMVAEQLDVAQSRVASASATLPPSHRGWTSRDLPQSTQIAVPT